MWNIFFFLFWTSYDIVSILFCQQKCKFTDSPWNNLDNVTWSCKVWWKIPRCTDNNFFSRMTAVAYFFGWSFAFRVVWFVEGNLQIIQDFLYLLIRLLMLKTPHRQGKKAISVCKMARSTVHCTMITNSIFSLFLSSAQLYKK